MNNKEILKVIDLINNRELEKAVATLRQHILKSENKVSFNLVKLVKKIIENKELQKTRPALAGINHDKNNEQLICDGFVAVKWKQHESCLDILPQTPQELSINLDQVFINEKEFIPTENDITILNNLKKYREWFISNFADGLKSFEKKIPCFLFNRVFDLKVVENTLNICLSYNEYLKFSGENEFYKPVQIENSHIKALILPLKVIEDNDLNKIKETTENFCKGLKG